MSGLTDYLLSRPSAADRFKQLGLMSPAGLVDMAQPQGYGPAQGWEAKAQRLAMNKYGYSPEEWKAIDSIIERESGWDPNALNESSGAYGIPQILPSAHPDVQLQNDPLGQIRWLFNYIDQRYGGALEALQFKDTHGWY